MHFDDEENLAIQLTTCFTTSLYKQSSALSSRATLFFLFLFVDSTNSLSIHLQFFRISYVYTLCTWGKSSFSIKVYYLSNLYIHKHIHNQAQQKIFRVTQRMLDTQISNRKEKRTKLRKFATISHIKRKYNSTRIWEKRSYTRSML